MKDLLKGIVWVSFILLLFGASMKVSAGTDRDLRALLEGKRVVYQGACGLDARGHFPEQESSVSTLHPCIMGVDDSEEGEIYYVLYLDPRTMRGTLLLRVNKDTKEQSVLWTNKTEV